VAALLGLNEGEVDFGGAPWHVTPVAELGRYAASATLGEDQDTAWIDLEVTGSAKIRGLFKTQNRQGELKWLVNGAVAWESGNSSSDLEEIHIELPSGSHTVRVQGQLPEDHYGDDLVIHLLDLEVMPLEDEGLGGDSIWAYSGQWERGMEGEFPVIRPTAMAKFHGGAPGIRRLGTGPGIMRFGLFIESPDSSDEVFSASWILSDSWGRERELNQNSWEPGWSEVNELWLPAGANWVEWKLNDHSDMGKIAIRLPEFEPWDDVSFAGAMNHPGLTWTLDAELPWSGVRSSSEAPPVVVSPPLNEYEEAQFSTVVQGPGTIILRWKFNGTGHGNISLDADDGNNIASGESAGVIGMPITASGPVEVRFKVQINDLFTWAEISDFQWVPFDENSLGLALDAGEAVAWETGEDYPLTAYPNPNAVGYSAAKVDLPPGASTWLEATVDGPGLFDFWLLDIFGSGNTAADVEWELFIDGVKSHYQPDQSTWPEQWVFGEGEHRIRLKFSNPADSGRTLSIGVDNVSWTPLVAQAVEGWSTNVPDGVRAFISGGRGDEPQVVLPLQSGEAVWVEKSVTGPGLITWSERAIYGGHAMSSRKITVDGICELPLQVPYEWETYRLYIPEGVHTVRWISEPFADEGEPYPNRADSAWQISGLTFTAGVPQMMEAIDDDANVWLAVGDEPGSLAAEDAQLQGGDAWVLGKETSLYLCNVGDSGLIGRGKVFGFIDWEFPLQWSERKSWVGPGEVVKWTETVEWSVFDVEDPPRIVDGFSSERIPFTPLNEALDTDCEIENEGWIGLLHGENSSDGVDAAWSQVTTGYESKK
jgi:hypothetical protein